MPEAMQLINFFDWYRSLDNDAASRPWLVLGKGPSFSSVHNLDTSAYTLFGLNHVVSQINVDIAHAIDLDVVTDCADSLRNNAKYLLMPWHPHLKNRPGKKNLQELAPEVPVIAWFAARDRLLWYNKSGSPRAGHSPVVDVTYFSAEVPYSLLGQAGAKVIRTLGVDGGQSYSREFDRWNTLLTNKQPSFNKQFKEIARSIMKFQLDVGPLDDECPIRVFVAATEEQMLAVKVLEYSIKKNTSMSVEVTSLHTCGIEIPQPAAKKNWPRTPFSFQRFLIPHVMGHRGRAIYLDSDMQVFSDMRELWRYALDDYELLSVAGDEKCDRKPQYSVMLMDCAKLDWNIQEIVKQLDDDKLTYEQLMGEIAIANRQAPLIPTSWNSLEKYQEGKTDLLHYTDMNTQPWIYPHNPLGYLWVRDLLEAIGTGFISRDYVLDHIERGWIRPSLAFQIDNRLEDGLLLPKHALEADKNFSPPYHALPRHSGSPWRNRWAYYRAALRHKLADTPPFLLLRRALSRLRT